MKLALAQMKNEGSRPLLLKFRYFAEGTKSFFNRRRKMTVEERAEKAVELKHTERQ